HVLCICRLAWWSLRIALDVGYSPRRDDCTGLGVDGVARGGRIHEDRGLGVAHYPGYHRRREQDRRTEGAGTAGHDLFGNWKRPPGCGHPGGRRRDGGQWMEDGAPAAPQLVALLDHAAPCAC